MTHGRTNARDRALPHWIAGWIRGAGLAVALTVHQVFILGRMTGLMLLENAYLYALLALLLPLAFLIFPLRLRGHWLWPVDMACAAATAGILGYYAIMAETMIVQAWEYTAPQPARYAALVLWVLVMEAARRAGGLAILIVIATLRALSGLCGLPAGRLLRLRDERRADGDVSRDVDAEHPRPAHARPSPRWSSASSSSG